MTALGTFDPAHLQRSHRVRCEWGPSGAHALVGDLGPGDLAIVVDVLSFSTTVTVAVELGMQVWPCRWRDERAERLARDVDAVLAVGRLESRAPGAPPRATVSLSPAEMAGVEDVPRAVLPSPNGSTISAELADSGLEVVAGCLRNAGAVALRAWEVLDAGGSIVVVACGERWPDGTLRPAAEDWWGAGAVLAALPGELLSPEAALAASTFTAVDDLGPAVLGCASGHELAARGYLDDVGVAATLDVTAVVPTLRDGRFVG
ncbi:2-phosphosulfolactate phosphatase [Nocardioides sp. TRM66260-LWL]|uniref:2-phosphosulfolactate phosphatase n=1 Tax=Nocardioides sp. TRM66260-LWL TaxID=2874478 RepID=UPI001CC5700C|nr:2-phosphosulfolactate phosphatase [Nocardioides sp. TRM66260-LWL]MBZ5735484.1 2-phosphosulfolactate phosphatase [Nocardioides sp. TRM66260-LWL]